jgi:predicted DNA-binding transcriptional regulator AlpA
MTVVEQLKAKRGLIHADELAPLLGMNTDKLYQKTKAGEVPHYRLLGRVKYDPCVIIEWMQQREVDLDNQINKNRYDQQRVGQIEKQNEPRDHAQDLPEVLLETVKVTPESGSLTHTGCPSAGTPARPARGASRSGCGR